MNQLYDAALRSLGTVTVAFTFLDAACEAFLKMFEARLSPHLTVGGKISKIEQLGNDTRLDPMRTRLNDWVKEVRLANQERNRAVHDLMFYGYADAFPGIVQMRDGKHRLVDPEQLNILGNTLTKLAMDTWPLIREAEILLGCELIEQDET